jgi:hypothetical protein
MEDEIAVYLRMEVTGRCCGGTPRGGVGNQWRGDERRSREPVAVTISSRRRRTERADGMHVMGWCCGDAPRGGEGTSCDDD